MSSTDMQADRRATAEEARQLTERIKAALAGTWQLIIQAHQTRCDIALGYASWDAYCVQEFSTFWLRVPLEERRETVAALREAGLSLRAIASATGQSQANVRNDLAGVQSSQGDCTSDGQPVRGGVQKVTGLDGRVYPSSQSAPAPAPAPAPNFTYPAPPRPPAPAPLHLPPPSPVANPFPAGPAPKPQPVMLTLRTHTGEEFPYPQPQSRAAFNETAGEGISWAAWSWNPVTGCLHGCDYCYARAITARFPASYPAGFTPLFHSERLDAPVNTKIPAQYADNDHQSCGRGDCKVCAYRRVFVCSMADLYGRWVPDEWIAAVHESMLASPQWEYLLLTKFPGRYPGLTLPPASWVGTSVDEQKRVRIAEDAFRQISGVKVKWLSLEPLREPLEFTDLSMFDWVVIGAQTPTDQPDGHVAGYMPQKEWVLRITAQAKEAGCRVHWKPNLGQSIWYDEYPQ